MRGPTCVCRRASLPLTRSKVTIRKAAGDVYAATIDDKVAMKIGPGDWSPNSVGIKVNGKEFKVVVSGFQVRARASGVREGAAWLSANPRPLAVCCCVPSAVLCAQCPSCLPSPSRPPALARPPQFAVWEPAP